MTPDWVAIAQASVWKASGDCAFVAAHGDGQATFFVGDVTGHDARAAELARELGTCASILAERSSPGALLSDLNRAVAAT